ncbi:MAG: phosphatidate cytidylyltransferase, partial [Planctomycetes bacterium]|nr:phosphatidate cytidylyltransferase [Planctomycetota bacterium]
MLAARLILGPLFVAALVGLCWLDFHAVRPGTYLLPLAMVLGLLGAGELLTMFRRRVTRAQPLAWVVYGGTLLTVLAAGAPAWLPADWHGGEAVGRLGWLAMGLVASLLLAMIGEMQRYEGPGQATENLALSCLAVLYVGGLTGFLVQLRLLGLDVPGNDAKFGMFVLAWLVLIVKLSDTGQYTAGRMFGVHKLAPGISPGKTWEGVLGGLLFAILGGFIAMWLGRRMGAGAGMSSTSQLSDGRVWSLLVYSLAVAAAGILG